MSQVAIVPVTTKAEMKTFVQFANRLYEGNKYYCPTLDFDELNIFRQDKNPALQFSEYALFLAKRGNDVVGRIAAIINHRANEAWNVKKLRFGWFDFVDDPDVSRALLDAAREWGKKKGMTEMNGPVGFTDMDKEGLLIEGYEEVAAMPELYNYPYYVRHFEDYGFQKEADWIAIQITPPTEIPERWQRMADIVQRRSKLHIVKVKNSKELLKRYPNMEYFDVLSDAYSKLYNYQPLTKEQKRFYSEYYFGLLNFDFVTIIENEQNQIVALGLGMPDLTEALKKANGSLFPFGWYHLLKALKAKKMDAFDLLLIAVRPDYQEHGAHALIFAEQIPWFVKYGIKRVETTSILETNTKNLANFTGFEHRIHKRRRAYIRSIG
ncbi:MAG: N-acetyltransferase [Paludibacteraceae bacterium]|nr:N-acetyltransferase [Paludibacteraceae bacterium]